VVPAAALGEGAPAVQLQLPRQQEAQQQPQQPQQQAAEQQPQPAPQQRQLELSSAETRRLKELVDQLRRIAPPGEPLLLPLSSFTKKRYLSC
jgi:transcriptional regulator with AAA-type ATPase domain